MSAPSPQLRMGRHRKELTQNQITARVIIVVLVVTNIVAALTTGIIIAIVRLTTRDKVRGWHVLLAGLAAIAIGLASGLQAAYWAPWKQAISLLSEDPTQPGNAIDAMSDKLGHWALGQIPFAICLALLVAGIFLTWRDRYRQTWREDHKPKKPASPRAIAAAKKRLDNKAGKAQSVATPNDLTLPLGIDATTAKPVTIAATSLRTHAVVVGPTGLGKTEALKRLIWAMCAQPAARALKIPAIVVDMKADNALADWMEATARSIGRPFHKITLNAATSTTGYVALEGRSPDEIADMVYEMTFAGDPTVNQHYATLSRRLLQTSAHALVDLADAGILARGCRRWQVTLPDLARMCSLDELNLAFADASAEVAARISRYLTDVAAADNEKDVGDIRDRLAIITDTAMGQILAQPGLNLREAIHDGAFVCFSLDAAGSPESARVMGRLAIQDISATCGALTGSPWAQAGGLCPIILDEFSALATPKVADLFARVRAAGGAVILSTQDLDGDLTAVSPQFAATVRTNANVWIVTRQTRGELAESIAFDIGTATSWKETVQIEDDWDPLGGLHSASGVGSLREAEEFIIHPNEIRTLPKGAAIVIVKVPAGSLHKNAADTQIQRVHISQAPPAEQAPPHLPAMAGPAVTQAPQQQPTATFTASLETGIVWDDADTHAPPPPEPPDEEES